MSKDMAPLECGAPSHLMHVAMKHCNEELSTTTHPQRTQPYRKARVEQQSKCEGEVWYMREAGGRTARTNDARVWLAPLMAPTWLTGASKLTRMLLLLKLLFAPTFFKHKATVSATLAATSLCNPPPLPLFATAHVHPAQPLRAFLSAPVPAQPLVTIESLIDASHPFSNRPCIFTLAASPIFA